MTDRLDQGRGNQADYNLGTILGWDAFEVVRWHGVEELSQPYEYDITLRRGAQRGAVDLDQLVDTGATFRIASESRWRAVHGVVAEAEEIDRTREQIYYRVLLVPPVWRMRYRRGCRTFVERTLKEIVSCVLENRSYPGGEPAAGLLPLSGHDIEPPDAHPSWDDVVEPHGRYVWRVNEDRRITHEALHAFVAQYNESDLDFVARLLEHEGITYYFEHAKDSVVMVLTDAPGQDPLHETDRSVTLRGGGAAGAHRQQELVRWLKNTRRMRSRSVTMREYDYRRSTRVFDGRTAGPDASDQAFGHFEFPAKDERLEGDLGVFQSRMRLERFEVERRQREGMSTVRTLLPGHAVKLLDGDGLRDDEELLIVRSETYATQLGMDGSLVAGEPFGFDDAGQEVGGFENRFQVVDLKTPFRPAKQTPRPKIWGVHVAHVWGPDTETMIDDADKSLTRLDPVDIHCDDLGRIKIRLPWDTRALQDKKPPSDWCRVAQPWAGKAYGAMHIPRVGHEVLVAYEDGDPDRPVVVGSVYTPGSPPPYNTQSALDKSRTTLKSNSTDVTEPREGYNELRFTDLKKDEEIYLHAQKDLNEVVLNDHSTTVGGDQSNTVGGNQSNTVHQNRTHDVTGTESVHVHGDRTTQFDANEYHTVNGFLTTKVGANEKRTVGGYRSTDVGINDDLHVGGWRNTTVDVGENRTVTGPDMVVVTADRRVTVSGNHHMTANANHTMDSTNMYVTQAGTFQVNASTICLIAGGASILIQKGKILIDNGAGASISLSGAGIWINSGEATNLKAGGDINATAPNIHLNG